MSRQSSPQKESASGLGAQAENSLRAAPNHERGVVLRPPFGLLEVKTQVWVQGQQQPLKQGGLGRGVKYVSVGSPSGLKPFLPPECRGRGRAPSAPCPSPRPVIFCPWARPPALRAARINILPARSDPSSEGAGGRFSGRGAGSHAKGGEENHIYRIGISLNGALS